MQLPQESVQQLGDFYTQGVGALAVAYFIEWLKKLRSVPIVTRETSRLNHLLAIVLTGLTSLGIHLHYDAGTLTVTGLAASQLLPAAGNWIYTYVISKAGYHALIANRQTLQIVQEAPQAQAAGAGGTK